MTAPAFESTFGSPSTDPFHPAHTPTRRRSQPVRVAEGVADPAELYTAAELDDECDRLENAAEHAADRHWGDA